MARAAHAPLPARPPSTHLTRIAATCPPAGDFIKLGFLAPGTDIAPIVPALEKIWADSMGQSMADFNFRTVTSKFNELVYQYPIRIPERYSLVIRSLLTQEGICITLKPDFRFLEVAYPYVARRLLTDEDPALRERLLQVGKTCASGTSSTSGTPCCCLLHPARLHAHVAWQHVPWRLMPATPLPLSCCCSCSICCTHVSRACLAPPSHLTSRPTHHSAPAPTSPTHHLTHSPLRPPPQVLFQDGKFQWKRLENLIMLAREGGGSSGLDLSDTVKDALRVLAQDDKIRSQLLLALTEDNRLHVAEVMHLLDLVRDEVEPSKLAGQLLRELPSLSRAALLGWADRVLVS